ncbi:ABC transporter substrate-binding protein [Jatrophihabitans cynanchi]|uniref:ABC transporter substrate-binding protein n=1 Tax=Jatrophihabitans cynanchi TaxID=2944128 RepID=A0ABY7JVY7_9ACTN|nr:ABC transporter substrate-binding protein [Jatrophihabitans sp. SB3-54]WAX56711.1 ABC transporter substrate-binding protein [Jatrophihabitans sp. SB3-54]
MRWKRMTAVLAAGSAVVALAAGCSSSGNKGGGGNGTNNGTSSNGPDLSKQPKSKIKAVTMTGDCAPYGKYGKYTNATVTMYSSITDPEGQHLQDSWKQFEQCTGIKIAYTADKEFESSVKTKVQGGNAPDIAIIPQPGLLQSFATSGKLVPATDALTKEASDNWTKDWISYATVDGVYFGAPMGANLKSLVWYSPKYFKQYGYTVPTTWDDMIKLSDKMAADGHKPWCAGIESGTATGWPATDWMEEVMLRLYGPEVYDQWVNHQIPFNDQKVQDVLAKVGQILKNPKYVNAGIGDVKSIATTAFQKGGLPIETGKCMLHQQASFYAANWDKGYKVAQDGDLYAFYEPTMSDKFGKPIEGGGEFVTAFADRPEVESVQLYLASGEWATSRIKVASGWVSANNKADKNAYTDPIDKLSAQLLTDPSATFRFDGSDAMPAEVGAGSFWTQMTQWILGQSDKDTLDKIEASWPK